MDTSSVKASAPCLAKAGGGLRFSLRSLILLIALIAGMLAWATYHRRLSVRVTYRIAAVEAVDVEPLLKGAAPIAGSNYVWVIVNDDAVAPLFKPAGRPAPLIAGQSRVISDWPKVAVAFTSSNHRDVIIDPQTNQTMPHWEQAMLGGFFGSRIAGSQAQLRIECDVRFERPDEDATPGFPFPHEHVAGKLFYEGKLPEAHLVFAAPLDDHSYHVVVFEADPVQSLPARKQ